MYKERTCRTGVKRINLVGFPAPPSVPAPYRHRQDIPLSLTAVADQRGRLPAVSATLIRQTAQARQGLSAA